MPEQTSQTCAYRGSRGEPCKGAADESGFCFWHNPDIPKTGPEIKHKLEQWARQGNSLEGIHLRRADLEDVDLVNENGAHGYNLSNANLYRANLNHAHLFRINLTGSNLIKASLVGASMNQANLEDADFLGTRMDQAKIESVRWGDTVLQEKKAWQCLRKGERQKANNLWKEAEEIYRNLRKVFENRGQFETAGHFFYREMVVRRYQMPLFSMNRLFSKMVDLFCGYAEKPLRVILFSLSLITGCAWVYFALGLYDGSQHVIYSVHADLNHNAGNLLQCIYFSIVTFTTLGYGDLIPQGFSRFVAAAQAFVGAFTMALFVVVFVKKMTR